MIHSAKGLVLGGLLAAGIVIASGCDRSPGRPAIDTSAIVGNWIELADQSAVNPRTMGARGGEKTSYRHLAISADNTFEFTLRTKSGKPANGKNKIEGSWTIKKNTIIFEVSSNTFGDTDERGDWAPESSIGIRTKTSRGKQLEVLSVVDLSGMPIGYVRAE